MAGADLWTATAGGYNLSFDEASGILSVSAIPEPSIYVLLGGGLAMLFFLRRRA